MMILLLIKVNWCRLGKWIIYCYYILRRRECLRDRNIIEAQGWNLRVDRLMRSATMFRAVKSAIVTFALAGSCTNTLWGVWRCLIPN